MLNHLNMQCFVVTAETLSITKTSQQMYMTRQAVSQQIQALEDSLGVELFVRMPNRLLLTPAGEAYLEIFSAFLASLSDIRARFGSTTSGKVPVSIGVMRTLRVWDAFYHIRDCCLALGENPDLNIQIYEPQELIDHMEDGSLDLIISMPLSLLTQPSKYGSFLYANKPQVMLVSQGIQLPYPEEEAVDAALERLPFGTWADAPLPIDRTSTLIKNWKRSGREIRDVRNYVNADTALAAAERGECVLICPSECIWTTNPKLTVLDMQKNLDYYCIWRKKPSNSCVAAYIQQLEKLYRETIEPLHLEIITPLP